MNVLKMNSSVNAAKNGITFCIDIGTILETYYNISDWTLIPPVRQTIITIYSVIFILSVIGNTCLVACIGRNPPLHTVRNIFVVNLAASDLSVALTSLPSTAYTSLYKYWILGEVACYAFATLQSIGVMISAFSLAAISVDRYILIVHPGVRPISKNIALFIVASIWTCAISVSLPSTVQYRIIRGENIAAGVCGEFCNEQWDGSELSRSIYGFCVLIVQLVLPLTVVIVSYALVFCRLRRAARFRQNMQRGVPQQQARQKAANQRQNKTNRILVLMVVCFVLAWSPRVLFTLADDLGAGIAFQKEQPYLMSCITHTIAMLSTLCNPILYGFMNESFRPYFIRMLPCLKLICTVSGTPSRSIVGQRPARRSVYKAVPDTDLPSTMPDRSLLGASFPRELGDSML